MSPRGATRAIVLLWAALQIALPAVAAVADALASRTSVHATAHAESRTERDCVRVHEADCVFCQFLSASVAPASSPVPEITVRDAERVTRLAGGAPPQRRGGSANPRAPPLV